MYVLVSQKAGVPLIAMEKYVTYVSRTVTIVHAGTRSAHSLPTSENYNQNQNQNHQDGRVPRDGSM